MYFELRMYQSAQGRLGDIVSRMQNLLPQMLRKHQFPWPVGQWVCVAGPNMPLYIWMLQWEDLDHRSNCFGGLYSDPEWDKIRISTNGIRDTVVEQRIVMLRHLPCHDSLNQLANHGVAQGNRLHELRFQRLQYGMLGKANQQMKEIDYPTLDHCGASILGAFEIISGAPVPSIASFMSWPNFESRQEALKQFETDQRVVAARKKEVEEINNHYLQEFDCYLLEPMQFCLPNPLLALGSQP